MSDMELFLRDYCGKCGRRCKAVDPARLRWLDDGRLACTRYVCAVLMDE